nr:PREDICTED: dual specificity testis-specific protein kinase 2 [Latimeria chalumnae]|eukprot:XP_014344571.1 PREDICTED: dual specificity testis-specific protein kinase 2 [Latimeria chalumnae]
MDSYFLLAAHIVILAYDSLSSRMLIYRVLLFYRFVGVCVHEGQLHALTEYMNGGNLEQLLDSNKYLSWVVRVKLAYDVAQGLSYLHSKGIFHRDLTSKNCLIRCDENVYSAVVGDFGLAEKIPDYSVDTEKLAVVGSPYWMAPEVLRNEPYNEKVVFFNFGLDYDAFQHMVGDCPPDFLQLAFNCCNMDPKLRPSFVQIVRTLEETLNRLHAEESERERLRHSTESIERKPASISKGPCEKGQGVKRLNTLVLQEDKIPPKSPRPRRSIWLSRSQSDIFSRKPPRKINVQDPYYTPGKALGHKINPFNAREDLKGGKVKFFDMPSKSVISLVFDLHSPEVGTSQPQFRQGCGFEWQDVSFLSTRRCRSLPVSPEPLPKDYGGFGVLPLTGTKCDPAQLESEMRPRLLSSSKYAVPEIPPFRTKSQRQEPSPNPAEPVEAMDCSENPGSQEENGVPPGAGEKTKRFKSEDGAPAQSGRVEQNERPAPNSVVSEGSPSFRNIESSISCEEMETDEAQRELAKPTTPGTSESLISVSFPVDENNGADTFQLSQDRDGGSCASIVLEPCMVSRPYDLQSKCDI